MHRSQQSHISTVRNIRSYSQIKSFGCWRHRCPLCRNPQGISWYLTTEIISGIIFFLGPRSGRRFLKILHGARVGWPEMSWSAFVVEGDWRRSCLSWLYYMFDLYFLVPMWGVSMILTMTMVIISSFYVSHSIKLMCACNTGEKGSRTISITVEAAVVVAALVSHIFERFRLFFEWTLLIA